MGIVQKLKDRLLERKATAIQSAEELAVRDFKGEVVPSEEAEQILQNAGKDVSWLESRVAWLQNRKELREQIDAGAEASKRLKEITVLLDKSAEKVLKEQRRHDAVFGEHADELRTLSHKITMANLPERKLSSMPDGELKVQYDSLSRQIGAIDERLEAAKQQHRPPNEIKLLMAQRGEVKQHREALQQEMQTVA